MKDSPRQRSGPLPVQRVVILAAVSLQIDPFPLVDLHSVCVWLPIHVLLMTGIIYFLPRIDRARTDLIAVGPVYLAICCAGYFWDRLAFELLKTTSFATNPPSLDELVLARFRHAPALIATLPLAWFLGNALRRRLAHARAEKS